MIRKLFFIIIVAILPLSLTSQEEPELVESQNEVLNIQVRNLDSLYIAWVEDRLMAPVTYAGNANDSLLPHWGKLPDSVYKQRLEAIPSVLDLTFNSRVKSFIEMYTQKRRAEVELMLGLADYYFPIFEKALADQGLPLELKYMPVIESGLNPVASSRVGAQGLWQFMYGTAKAYGLQMNSFVDERWDPVKSSQAAVQYLKDLFEIYGDWHLVIAAYNCGPGNVNKAIRRTGGKRNYWDIYYHLPKETRGYVPAFIASIYAMNYHHAHRMTPLATEYAAQIDTVWVEQDVHLKQISEVLDISFIDLKRLNPQYRRSIIPGVGGPYVVSLPNDKALDFVSLKDSIVQYKRDVYFSRANLNKSPSYSKYIPDAPKGNYVALTYKVKSGDNLGYIAEWYDVGLSRLRYWNNIYKSMIRVGQKLTVYVPKNSKSKYEKIDTMSFAEKQAL
ncbi:MAG: transglycosylase SLT domain-containing protein [Bacteroidales bacterium]|nr:transglycosylase SLT domain-containing protein [Bacteroidales bacterium]